MSIYPFPTVINTSQPSCHPKMENRLVLYTTSSPAVCLKYGAERSSWERLLPFVLLGKRGHSTSDFTFYIWKQNGSKRGADPVIPCASSSTKLSDKLSSKQESKHTSSESSREGCYLCLDNGLVFWNWTSRSERKNTEDTVVVSLQVLWF